MTMTPDAKAHLARTVRDLRLFLLGEVGDAGPPGALHNAVESEFRFGVRAQDAGLPEATRAKRKYFEMWIAEQVRATSTRKNSNGAAPRTAESFRREAEKQAAYTLLNRLVILRLMEESKLRKALLATSGWDSLAYKNFRELAQALVDDEAEGFGFLIGLVFDDLAIDLPGLYGSAGVADLVPITTPIWRRCINSLNVLELNSCWTDDMTLGWVYQYWNDPEREELDAKLNAGGKLEPHEIASKTQMFTERYIVDWLLQNSLGPMWFAVCRKNGWIPEVEANGTLAALEQRRIEWRGMREAGEVSLSALMPLSGPDEEHWAYYVQQPIADDAVTFAPESIRELKILDPAVGSGHFLVVAFELLVALYQEEARHRSEAGEGRWDDRAIVECILENNLHGIDLDPRAVQIAAASLWLKARQFCPAAQPASLNLVATALGLSSLPPNDPALIELRHEVERETGIPAVLTDTIVHALKGADHLGSLLKTDSAVEAAIARHDKDRGNPIQGDLFNGFGQPQQLNESATARDSTILEKLEKFLARHTTADDLGLRLHGEQLAAGIRFVQLAKGGSYDIVVANPPYQGTSRIANSKYLDSHYGNAKADLYACFLLRGIELARPGGFSAMLAIRNWLFVKQYAELRHQLLRAQDLRILGDLNSGAFEEISAAQVVVSVAMTVFCRSSPRNGRRIALRFFTEPSVTQAGEVARKRAATIVQMERYDFEPRNLKTVPDWPLIYWWTPRVLSYFSDHPKIGDISPSRATQGLYNNGRFVRQVYEIQQASLRTSGDRRSPSPRWTPLTNGASGQVWFEPLRFVANWGPHGLEAKTYMATKTRSNVFNYANEDFFFRPNGVSYSMIGACFSARKTRWVGIFANMGLSIFSDNTSGLLAWLNSTLAAEIMSGLNPTVHFTSGDVNRLPLLEVAGSDAIVERLESSFVSHEQHREPAVEFQFPGPSAWHSSQEWAKKAVDRPEHTPLAPFEPVYDPEPPSDHVSFALGLALGRFGENGAGLLDPAKADLTAALPNGILFLDGTLAENDRHDSLGHPASGLLHAAWDEHGHVIAPGSSLRTYLRARFFGDVHRKMYENRPIHWPLSSEKKTFVAWINIHRWDGGTLLKLLADHLSPIQLRFKGEVTDLTAARDGADKKASKDAERQLEKLRSARLELETFVNNILQCAEKGPPPTDSKCTLREVDARYVPDLDDGVMINSAALWPLLEPQWKDPKKWWKELANAEGKKDYDWSHLAMRYWPTRVDAKCRKDPSLGVAHGCFWKYHPGRAWAWELRLQDEIGPGFRIQEASYRGDEGDTIHRAAYLAGHLEEVLDTVESETLRRRRKHKKPQHELHLLESGLWSQAARLCWDLEIRVSEKQGSEFFLRAPDEPEARAAFEAANSAEASRRRILIQSLRPAPIVAAPDDAEDADELDDDGEESDA